jgi:hypothetical protein
MPWFKVDDGFSTSRKVISIPRRDRLAAVGLWTMAGNFAAKELTDGHVPAYVLDDLGATPELIDLLVASGLWDRDEQGEIWFHDWCEYQPSASEYREKQAKLKAKRSEDGKIAAAKRWHRVDDAEPNGSPNGFAMGQDAPEPEPEPLKIINVSFDEFWAAYPRSGSKPTALKSFARALKRADAETIIEGAKRYAADPNRDPSYTKLPATWLNNDCWADPPLPTRNTPTSNQPVDPWAGIKVIK